MKKLRWIILGAVTLVLFCYIYFKTGIPNIVNCFKHLDYRYFAAAVAIQLFCNASGSFATHYLRLKYQKAPFYYTLHSTFYGISIGSLLPAILSAGAVSEVSLMNIQGLDVHKSSSMFLARQVSYFIAICTVPIIFIFLNLPYFRLNSTTLLNILYIIGFTVNVITIFFYAFVGRANRVLYLVASILILGLSKIRIVKKPDTLKAKIKNTLDSLKEQMENLPLKFYDWIFLIFVFAINFILGNLVSYFSIFALGIEMNGSFSQLVAASAFVNAVQGTVPVPSGLGVADLTYLHIMKPLVGENIDYLYLLWRIISFYIPIIVSALVMLLPIPGRRRKINQS